MADDTDDRAHKAVAELARSLEVDGVHPYAICDALVVTGCNAAICMLGREPAIEFFKKVTATLESGLPETRIN